MGEFQKDIGCQSRSLAQWRAYTVASGKTKRG
jgi:hypothetical protein